MPTLHVDQELHPHNKTRQPCHDEAFRSAARLGAAHDRTSIRSSLPPVHLGAAPQRVTIRLMSDAAVFPPTAQPTRLVNLTPHAVTLLGGEHSVTLEPAGPAARVTMATEVVETLQLEDGLSLSIRQGTPGAITGLPDPEPGVVVIVSRLVADAALRSDVVYPDDLVRNDTGQVIGCRGLGRPAGVVPLDDA